jgi:hypothetical protein
MISESSLPTSASYTDSDHIMPLTCRAGAVAASGAVVPRAPGRRGHVTRGASIFQIANQPTNQLINQAKQRRGYRQCLSEAPHK